MSFSYKVEKSINAIIRRYLSDEQIEKNYQNAYKRCFPNGGYNKKGMDTVVKKCREMALDTIPLTEFTPSQVAYIHTVWKINIQREVY